MNYTYDKALKAIENGKISTEQDALEIARLMFELVHANEPSKTLKLHTELTRAAAQKNLDAFFYVHFLLGDGLLLVQLAQYGAMNDEAPSNFKPDSILSWEQNIQRLRGIISNRKHTNVNLVKVIEDEASRLGL